MVISHEIREKLGEIKNAISWLKSERSSCHARLKCSMTANFKSVNVFNWRLELRHHVYPLRFLVEQLFHLLLLYLECVD